MTPRDRLIDALPSLILMGVAVFYLFASFDYDQQSRAMPLGVAMFAIGLVLLDVLSRGEGRLARLLRRIFRGKGGEAPVPGLEGQAGQRHAFRRELGAFAWIVAFLGLVLIAGFYIAIPIYVVVYLHFYAGKTLPRAGAAALALTALLFVMFELLLGYEVFGGLIAGDFM